MVSCFHIFCDASNDAAIVFVKCETDTNISVQIIQAKSRLSPTKRISVPRVEFLGATIAARLFATVKKALNCQDIPTYFWTDSTAVLSWIKLTENWKPFVWNWIEEIHKLTKAADLYFVPGTINPADLPSRGCTASRLLDSFWWEGPHWLKEERQFWPQQNYETDEDKIMEERKKSITTMLSPNKNDVS